MCSVNNHDHDMEETTMSKTKIAYLPLLNFNDPADLCSRILGAEYDMMEEGLTIFHQEDNSLCPRADRRGLGERPRSKGA